MSDSHHVEHHGNGWMRIWRTDIVDVHRSGWHGVWDAIKAAVTGNQRFAVPTKLTFSVFVKGGEAYLAFEQLESRPIEKQDDE